MIFFFNLDRIITNLLGLITYISAYGKSIKNGYKSNAFSPLAWFVFFLAIPIFIVLLTVNNNAIKYTCLVILIVLVIFPLIMYVILLFKDPKLLQSEWYRLEDKKMDMIAQQGGVPTLPESLQSAQIKGEIDE